MSFTQSKETILNLHQVINLHDEKFKKKENLNIIGRIRNM